MPPHTPAIRATSVALAIEVVNLLEARHFAGAQALASCALDPLASAAFARGVIAGLVPRPDGLNDDRYEEWARALMQHPDPNFTKKTWVTADPPAVADRYIATMRNFPWAITLPVLLSAWTPSPKVIPGSPYSRHATAHPSDPGHFNESNALRALMTVVSLLWALKPSVAL